MRLAMRSTDLRLPSSKQRTIASMGRSGSALGIRARRIGRWCYWRYRCRPSQDSSTASLPKPLAFSSSAPRCLVWLSPEEQGQQIALDPLLTLLTLPVRPEAELKLSTQNILERRPEQVSTILTMIFSGFPHSPHRKSC
jgi:hypothetical protein